MSIYIKNRVVAATARSGNNNFSINAALSAFNNTSTNTFVNLDNLINKTEFNTYTGTTAPSVFLSKNDAAALYLSTTATTTQTIQSSLQMGKLLLINAPTGNPEFDFRENGTTRAKTYYDVTNNRLTFQNNENNKQDALYFADHATYTGNITTATGTISGATIKANTNIYTPSLITSDVRSSNYNQYYLGQGFAIYTDATGYTHLTIDNAHIRQTLDVQTLSVNNTKFVDGITMFSNGVKAIDLSGETAGIHKDSNGYYFNVDYWKNSMQAGMLIRSQRQSATGIEMLEYTVQSVSGSKVYINFVPTLSGSTEYDNIAINNVDVWSWSGESYYSAEPSLSYQYAETSLISFAEGNISVSATVISKGAPGSGNIIVALYNSDNTLLSTIGVAYGSAALNKTVTIPNNIQLKLRYTLIMTGSPNWEIYKPKIINNFDVYQDVKDREFARVNGNLIMIDADTELSPRIDLMKNVTAFNPTSDNIVVRIGELSGLTANSENCSGLGLYVSDNAYVSGYVNATSGKIGDIYINNGKLSSSYNTQRFDLDVQNNGLFFYNSAGDTAISIHGNNIINVDDIISITNKSYTGSYASTYTTKTVNITTNGTVTNNWYIGEYESSASYIKQHTTVPDDAYKFDVSINNRYTINGYATVNYSYSVPSGFTITEGLLQRVYSYSASGNYNITTTDEVYDADNNMLASKYTPITNRVSQNLSIGIISVFATSTNAKIYIKNNVAITNNFKINENIKIYYDGVLVNQSNNTTAANVTFTFFVSSLTMNGSTELGELGSDGINLYYSSSNYYTVKKNRTNFIKTAGNQYHSASMFTVTGTIFTANLQVSDTLKVKSIEYDEKYSTATSYTLDNNQGCYIYGGSANATVTLPESGMLTGQQHIIINRTTAYTLTINGNIYDNGATYTSRSCPNRSSWTFIYNGLAWAAVCYR